jgi:hypothetical protein
VGRRATVARRDLRAAVTLLARPLAVCETVGPLTPLGYAIARLDLGVGQAPGPPPEGKFFGGLTRQ